MDQDLHAGSILSRWQLGELTDAQARGAAESLPDGEAKTYIRRVIDYTPSDVDPTPLA